jgi:ParB-like chromosome segregation protein Spo0J
VKVHSEVVVPIDSLIPDGANHNIGDIRAIATSLKQFGQTKAIVARAGDAPNVIIAGNHTWLAAREIGATEIKVTFIDFTDAEAEAYAVADNQVARLGSVDEGLLAERIRRIQEHEQLMLATALEPGYMASLLEMPLVVPAQLDRREASSAGSWPGDRVRQGFRAWPLPGSLRACRR